MFYTSNFANRMRLYENLNQKIIMKKILHLACFLLVCVFISSCSNDEMSTQLPVVRDSQTDMQVLSRFIDINESTNEYYINENRKTRALSYITGADWEELRKVSPLNVEQCQRNLQVLNNQVAMSIKNPNIAYIVFTVNGKTLVKKLRDTNFDFVSSQTSSASTRALSHSLAVTGGRDVSVGEFKHASPSIRMNLNIQSNYYFFEVLNRNAEPSPGSIAFSGTEPLWNTSFIWTADLDTQGTDGLFIWEFMSKGSVPNHGQISQCTFGY